VRQATGSPIATEALRRIAELYAIEAAIRGQTATVRQAVRTDILSGENLIMTAAAVIEGSPQSELNAC
jgi:hypothetical protein